MMHREVSIPIRVAKTARSVAWRDWMALIKPRPVSMVLLAIATGFYIGSAGVFEVTRFLWTLVASFFVGAGAMALNEWMERDADRKMVRTRNRPIPIGHIAPKHALIFGCSMAMIGMVLFVFAINGLSAVLALTTLASYLLIYTPLKKITTLATILGAVPGALPILMGWTSAGNALNLGAFSLFLIMFFWQIPHFLSIAWMYRTDYQNAGFKTLAVLDQEGWIVARQMVLHVCALMLVSLLPTVFGLTGTNYFLSAFLLGLVFASTIIFAAKNLDGRARFVLRASILYLTFLFIIMMVDKV